MDNAYQISNSSLLSRKKWDWMVVKRILAKSVTFVFLFSNETYSQII